MESSNGVHAKGLRFICCEQSCKGSRRVFVLSCPGLIRRMQVCWWILKFLENTSRRGQLVNGEEGICLLILGLDYKQMGFRLNRLIGQWRPILQTAVCVCSFLALDGYWLHVDLED